MGPRGAPVLGDRRLCARRCRARCGAEAATVLYAHLAWRRWQRVPLDARARRPRCRFALLPLVRCAACVSRRVHRHGPRCALRADASRARSTAATPASGYPALRAQGASRHHCLGGVSRGHRTRLPCLAVEHHGGAERLRRRVLRAARRRRWRRMSAAGTHSPASRSACSWGSSLDGETFPCW